MPRYGIPGVTTEQRGARRRGAAALLAVVTVGAAVAGFRQPDTAGLVRVRVVTTQVGAGIGHGSPIRVDGVPVGRLERIDSTAPGRQTLTLALRPEAATALTNTLTLDYAPANLFGLSEIALHAQAGGTPLRDGDLLDLSRPGRVADATLGRLLERLGATSGQVLTPELTTALDRVSSEIDALAPLLEAIVATARTVADTQSQRPSNLIGNYASALRGLGSLVEGSVTLLDQLARIPVLREDRAMFDRSVDILTDDIVPAVSHAATAGERNFAAYASLLVPVLRVVAAAVPDPRRSANELRQLLDHLDGALRSSTNGPALNVAVILHGVPAVAVPLLGAAAAPGGGR
ncbi:MlaD family protein [Nocardia brasiliensis]|uniref:MlaD family protein n=1 Tax=Nocardia brasiliensis TaxID=37326 RepID=UPI0006910418|nr:MlaD family protein [Nocardia brasiliensis]